jgi:hypothetical protein
MKVVVPSSVSKAPTSPSVPSGPLRLTCGKTGPEGRSFLVATATGGKAPYVFNVTAPDGVTFNGVTFNNADEQKQGSLFVKKSNYKAEDTAVFDLTVTDSGSPQGKAEIACAINIVPTTPGALDVECRGPANVNTAFMVADVYGGTEPFTYDVSPLPAQLVLDKDRGIITGASTPGTLDDVTITVTDKNNTKQSKQCNITVLPQPTSNLNCRLFPVSTIECVGYGPAKNVNINNFWGTNGGFVFFNQVKSIYNGASNSATVSADIGTLNFPFGMQLNIGSNVQAGSAPPTAVSTGTVPTLSPSAAAQAAQNMLYGGTLFLSGAYPILAVGGNRINGAGNWGGMLDVAAREGIDVQSFKSGTSTGLTSPSTHSSLQMEGYFQVNSTNLPTGGSGTFAGALFVGGSYGYSYTSHQYIRDYGIASPHNSLGQLSGGVIINGVAKIAFSKAFGPSQTYIDGTVPPPPPTNPPTPPTSTTVNNFKTLSFELSYQSPAPGSK